ncbi:hypothetical protein DVH24_027306 [Malus domestica]|uniref:Uncharacterized protein n=1 Tax=Malus domestica TaxID=3750 RepID=A0A498IQR5_MALDO|nr:hypothetical protein DVH24_027306 [Malus domestica]
MRALRSMGNIKQLFKRLTGVRACDASAAAVEPNVKVEYNISPSHPRHVIRFSFHPDDEQIAKKMMTANPTGIMD